MRNVGIAIRTATPIAVMLVLVFGVMGPEVSGQQAPKKPQTPGPAPAQASATPEQVLSYRPVQPDVEYDIPQGADIAKCTVKDERGNGSAGFVLYNPAGQILRRFVDSNGDGKADLYRYYRMGLEVYRDIDSNKNGKPDQYRWMNWGGTRWGIDQNEDGKIDGWRILSAQEAAKIAIEAMIRGDAAALQTVMLNNEDIRAIQVTADTARQLQESVADVPTKLRTAITSNKVISQKSQWVRFDPPMPGLILAEHGRAALDMTVYENAMAFVQNGDKTDLVMIGEMVRVGEVWKLTQVPTPLDGSTQQTIAVGGILMQPAVMTQDGGGNQPVMSAEMQDLLAQLEKIDKASPATESSAAQLARYNMQRAEVIEKLMVLPQSDDDRLQWIRQYADGVAAAVQTGEFADGLTRLTALEDKVKANEPLYGYVFYRRLLAEYAVRLKKAENEEQREAVQKWWLEQLEVFARRWPKAEDAADAIVQLAISLELIGRIDDARAWYTELAKSYERTNAGIRARGALKRLALTGTRMDIEGRSLVGGQPLSSAQYKGKVTLVVFWATWAMPFTNDLPKITDTYKKYQPSGFEILGVNLDSTADTIQPYLKQHGITWQSIRDAGGLDGQVASDFGIVLVPTMFIVDKNGVVAGSITTENLEYAVQTLLKGEKLETTRQSASSAPATTPAKQ
jgi:hypothetical protein